MLTPMEATRLQNDESAIFVDVREDKERAVGFIMDSHHLPMSNFEKRQVELDKFKEKPIIVYCANGTRSNGAASKLIKKEFKNVYSLTGGAVAWEKASLPLVTKG